MRQIPGQASGILSYFARHRTVANLLLVILVAAGLLAVPNMRAQYFPDVIEDEIAPGAVERYQALQELKERIGPDAAVCASGFALPHFAARKHIYHAPECRDSDWIVFLDRQLHRHEKDQLAALREDPSVEQVLSVERLWAFRRRPPEAAPADE